jgi:hypothetical protein
MRGRIEKIEPHELKDGRKYLSLSIDGETYSLWDEKYMSSLEEGMPVKYEWRKSGRFKNITKIERNKNQGYQNANKEKNEQIIKMSCLRSACEILANAHMGPLEKGKLAIDIARMYEAHVFGILYDEPELGEEDED